MSLVFGNSIAMILIGSPLQLLSPGGRAVAREPAAAWRGVERGLHLRGGRRHFRGWRRRGSEQLGAIREPCP